MGDVTLSLSVEHPSSGPGGAEWPDEARVSRIAHLVFGGEQRAFESISVVLADHATVLALNREWLEHDWTTDVISFLLEDDPIEGEVYVDVETAGERHGEFNATLNEEIERYIIHGMLHLCGYDDASDDERSQMRALEDRYLTLLDND